MSKRLILASAIGVLLCVIVGGASADRLVLTPTGSTLSTGGIKGEYANNADGDGVIYWANIGVSRFEIEGARFQDFSPDETDVVGIQAAVVPETSFTPALAIGVRNISDETGGLPEPYDERTLYAVITKSLPASGGVPGLISDLSVSGGVGTGGLSGFFFGVEGNVLPLGLRAAVEYDTEDWNWAVSYGIVSVLRAKVYSIKDDIYYGASLSIGF